MIEGVFDINFFNENGFFKTRIDDYFADMFLMHIKNECYEEDTPDEPDFVGYIEKYYKQRYISAADKNSQCERSPWKSMFVSNLIEYQKSLLRFYGHGCRDDLTNVSSYEGKKGYLMNWHQDIGDRCITECLLYLSDQPWNDDFGGEFQMSRVTRDADGKITNRQITHTVPPRHGDLVIMNNYSPHFEHRALEWRGNHSRFSLIAMLGISPT